jgi:cytochrome c biogenesis protein CcmG/thiol:disulfide interchange protein DsbE
MVALRWRYVAPLIVFLALAAALAVTLYQIRFEGRDIAEIPSPLINRSVPTFDLPPVAGRERGLKSDDLIGQVTLVNFFASWCAPCQLEHPVLTELAAKELVPVYGINYKDKPEDARRWLDRLGDPYHRAGADLDGRVGIEWGVYGLPETFIVDREGRIAYKHTGPIFPQDVEECILPLIEMLRGQQARAGAVDLPSPCR